MSNSEQSSSVQVAVVGSGYWGKNLVRNFEALGALRWVCESRPESRTEIEKKYPAVQLTSSFETIIKDEAIRGVVLATPAATHYTLAREALLAGKDVFVEKPLALSVSEGVELVKIANQAGRILMVGHILQYHPAIKKLRELIGNGTLGRIDYVYSNRLNMGKIRVEENILWSFAPHDVSVLLGLMGEDPKAVSCEAGAYLSHDIADVTVSQFRFPNGARAHIFVSWLHPFKEQRLVVVGSEQMAVFDDTAAEKLILYPHRVEWKDRIPSAIKADGVPVDVSSDEPLKSECMEFLDCIQTRRRPLTDGEEGLRVLRILAACQESMVTQKTVFLDQFQVQSERPFFVHPSAVVDEPCQIGEGTKIWHYTHVLAGARIGKKCILGQNCQIADGVIIGDNVKIQNNVSVYAGTEISDDVFLGPSCVLTNVTNPRSQINRHSLYEKTRILRGATVGANATIVCGIDLGRYCFIGAGSVVVSNVPDYALLVGNPARQIGWMSRHGHRLSKSGCDDVMVCPESGYRYKEVEPNILRCLDLDEELPLPAELAKGSKSYDEFKTKLTSQGK